MTPTKTQKKILDFVIDFKERVGAMPTLEDISKSMGFKGPSGAHYHVKMLKEMGMLESLPGINTYVQKNKKYPMEWEKISSSFVTLCRLKVPGGWLVQLNPSRGWFVQLRHSGFFYADPSHSWEFEDEHIPDGEVKS